MSHYIVCHKKRNNPRMNVRICQEKCHSKETCKAYISYHKLEIQNKNAALFSSEHQIMDLKAS